MKLLSIIALVGAVSSINIQRDSTKNWVELPDCPAKLGATDVALTEDNAEGHSPLNASSATCKVRPAAKAAK